MYITILLKFGKNNNLLIMESYFLIVLNELHINKFLDDIGVKKLNKNVHRFSDEHYFTGTYSFFINSFV